METKLSKMLRSVVAAGQARKVGDIVDLSEHEFNFLCSRSIVELAPAPKPAPKPEKKK
jgi:hypothetical protein